MACAGRIMINHVIKSSIRRALLSRYEIKTTRAADCQTIVNLWSVSCHRRIGFAPFEISNLVGALKNT